jgi:tight adherence protein B
VGAPLAVFLLVTAALVALFLAGTGSPRRGSQGAAQRMRDEFQPADKAAPVPLYKDAHKISLAPAPEGPAAHRRPTLAALRDLLDQADVPFTVGQVLAASALLGLGGGLAGAAFLGAWGAGAALLAGVPVLLLVLRRRARQESFLRQLAPAFELMARVMRAGQSVPHALEAVAEAFQPPLATEFARCEHQQKLGLRPEVAFREMAQRLGCLELRIFVMALLIQRQTGGSLCDVLERLAVLIRARLRLRRQIQTHTAEGRLQGLTLVVLPFILFAAIYAINRPYAEILLRRPGLLAATGSCMLFGVLWIRKILRSVG